MSLKHKLNRFKQHIIPKKQELLSEMEIPLQETNDIPFLEVWQEANVIPYYVGHDYCFIREKRYHISEQYGKYSFQDYIHVMQQWDDFVGDHPLSAKGFASSDLFFFDIETTGLGGGAGNTIFLLGYARCVDQEIIVRQHLLPEPGLEIPLYASFLEQVDYTTLVTYNGKSFDWPQVKTQHTLIREHVPKLPAFGHFDLYHAARRLWKHQLSSVKLAHVEKEILGITRKDDVPGYLAPMIYFDFVDRKNPEGILKIMEHNEKDILALMTLYTHLSLQIQQTDPQQTTEQKVLIGKWFQAIGENKTAIYTFQEAAKAENIEAKHQLAFYYKQNKRYEEARRLWEEVAEKGSLSFQKQASIELAKLMEHQFKQIDLAIKWTEKGIAIEKLSPMKTRKQQERFIQQASKRLNRLQKKSAKRG
ncbi:ribonuclease H-like domain-containing protein [Bacillus chungangensis]|uniref:Uncharacterized protein YprB with RNaseH-like and TPR domain n=1 Tax=Bacillus chungangensis TaxID=587633 RepID=A0ABT9WS95_9BACI|nr:ribonuclease H-like domain-containing protein [Bacillus chungangensis]MDQ0176156.1 uncharacterized protein YprB with RNaseH-like and TPR domain [Bacillus chungangensis]